MSKLKMLVLEYGLIQHSRVTLDTVATWEASGDLKALLVLLTNQENPPFLRALEDVIEAYDRYMLLRKELTEGAS